MDAKLSKEIEKNIIEYLSNKLLAPVFKMYLKYNEKPCYQIFTKELADVFDEYLYEYFETDYYSRVGQYYFSSLYGDYIPEEKLIEIIKAEDHQVEEFKALEVYFESFNCLGNVIEESVENMEVLFQDMNRLIIVSILKELNKNNALIDKL
jgi:hypothetical protein